MEDIKETMDEMRREFEELNVELRDGFAVMKEKIASGELDAQEVCSAATLFAGSLRNTAELLDQLIAQMMGKEKRRYNQERKRTKP